MLADAIARYVDLNRSIGMRFQVDEAIQIGRAHV